jgi:hypothetical protein
MDKLTTIASLPGSGGGFMSALPAERNDPPKDPSVYLDDEPMVYVPSLGCFIPVNWPSIGEPS